MAAVLTRLMCAILATAVLGGALQADDAEDGFRDYKADSKASYFGADFSPDGQILAAPAVNGPKQRGLVILWDVRTGKVIGRLSDFTAGCGRLAFSPHAERLAVACTNGSLHIFSRNRDVWRRMATVALRGADAYSCLEDLQFTSDGNSIITSAHELDRSVGSTVFICRNLLVLTPSSDAVDSRAIPIEPSNVTAVRLVGQDKSQVLISRARYSTKSHLAIIDLASGRTVNTLQLPDTTVKAFSGHRHDLLVSVANAGDEFAAVHNGIVYKINVRTLGFAKLFANPDPDKAFGAISLSADAKVLATCSLDGGLQLWDFTSGRLLWKQKELKVKSVQFSPQGRLLATTAIGSNVVRVWDIHDVLREE